MAKCNQLTSPPFKGLKAKVHDRILTTRCLVVTGGGSIGSDFSQWDKCGSRRVDYPSNSTQNDVETVTIAVDCFGHLGILQTVAATMSRVQSETSVISLSVQSSRRRHQRVLTLLNWVIIIQRQSPTKAVADELITRTCRLGPLRWAKT